MPRIRSYAGPLTAQQAADGIQVALLNARTLLLDARVLLQSERWPRAAALAILAIEEAGKVPIIRAILVARSESELRDEWRAYRSHTKKNVMGQFFAYVKEENHLENFRPLFDPTSDFGATTEAFKQLAMYSDYVGDGRWASPDVSIDSDLAEMVIDLADKLIPSGEGAMQSPEELALWVEHLGPVVSVPRSGGLSRWTSGVEIHVT